MFPASLWLPRSSGLTTAGFALLVFTSAEGTHCDTRAWPSTAPCQDPQDRMATKKRAIKRLLAVYLTLWSMYELIACDATALEARAEKV